MKKNSDFDEGINVQSLVELLPDETPSMAWRSSLNEKLLIEADRRVRRRTLFRWMTPTLGLASAGVAAGLFFMAMSPVGSSGAGLEAALIAEYRSASEASIVAGPSSSLTPGQAESLDEELWKQTADEIEITL